MSHPLLIEKQTKTVNAMDKIIQKWPMLSDILLSTADWLAINQSTEFFKYRTAKSLVRQILSFSWMKSEILYSGVNLEEQPVVEFRLISVHLNLPFGMKQTTGLCIICKNVNDYQILNERGILKAVGASVPNAQTVQETYFNISLPNTTTRLIYIEFEKSDGTPLSRNEKKELKRTLGDSLVASVEDLVPSVFMTKNEQDITNQMILLSQELKTIDDLPQVTISLDKHNASHLIFRVILARIIEQSHLPIRSLIGKKSEWDVVIEKQRVLSTPQEDFTKEVNVINLQLKKNEHLVRANASIHLHRARQTVIDGLTQALGPIRIFQGGIVDRQNDRFAKLLPRFQNYDAHKINLLEDCFFSLYPGDESLHLPLKTLENFLHLFIQALHTPLDHQIPILKHNSEESLLCIAIVPSKFSNSLQQTLSNFSFLAKNPITTRIDHRGHTYLGIITQVDDDSKRLLICQTLEHSIANCIANDRRAKTLRICLDHFPTTLDPRATLLPSATLLFKLLFDGLFRLDEEGNPTYALAKSHSVSSDGKQYTFHLRESTWNNGDPVTAEDFVHAWKSVLEPSSETPFSFILYPIKNAKKIKQGESPVDSLGVQSPDPYILIVDLEYPCPHFLHYLCLNIAFPIHHKQDKNFPDWSHQTQKAYFCNGPFKMDKLIWDQHLHLIKNHNYWDLKRVRLEAIDVKVGSHKQAKELFHQQKIDWLGSPFNDWSHEMKSPHHDLNSICQARTTLFLVNTKIPPLSNTKIRQALSLAIDRENLIKNLPYDTTATTVLLPPLFTALTQTELTGNLSKAKQLFEEGLKELQLTPEEFPSLTVLQTAEVGANRHRFLNQLKTQLKKVLGIDIEIQMLSWKQAYGKALKRDFHLFLNSWVYSARTPFYLLDFLASSQTHDLHQWNQAEYLTALDQAHLAQSKEELHSCLKAIEHILAQELPFIPLFHASDSFIHNERLKGFFIDRSISLFDFKEAYFKAVHLNPKKQIQWISPQHVASKK